MEISSGYYAPEQRVNLGKGLGHRGGGERRVGAPGRGPVGAPTLGEKPVRRARGELSQCSQRCARPTGDTHGRTTRGGPVQRRGGRGSQSEGRAPRGQGRAQPAAL